MMSSNIWKDFDRVFLGFDDHFRRVDKMLKDIPTYPPYNIRKTSDTTYVVELAVAGFAKQDIEIELKDDTLIIRGNTGSDGNSDFIHRGIANRAFTRSFVLNDNVEVKNAALLNGMLQVFLEHIIPESKKPRKIEISDEPSTVSHYAEHNQPPLTTTPQLLVEETK